MIEVNNLKYNSSEVSGVTYNSNSLASLSFNEYRWDASGGTPIITDFSLIPIMMLSEKHTASRLYNLNIESLMYVTGNSVFLAKVDGETDLSQLEVLNYSPEVMPMPIDDWGILFSRLFDYGRWEGGIYIDRYNITETLKVGTKSIDVRFTNETDEDNIQLFDGCYVNKVVRIPSTGISNTSLSFFSYMFSFNEFGKPYPYFYILDYQKILNNEASYPYVLYNGSFYDEKLLGRVYTSYEFRGTDAYPKTAQYSLQDTMLTDLSLVPVDSLNFKVNYSIGANPSSSYRHLAIIIQGGLLINFLQEPASSNRIYFGIPHPAGYERESNGYIDNYTHTWVSPHTDNYLFHTLGSYDLSKYSSGEEYIVKSYDRRTKYTLLYPVDIEQRFTITVSSNVNSGVLSEDTLSWGNVSYKMVTEIGYTVTYTFRKR